MTHVPSPQGPEPLRSTCRVCGGGLEPLLRYGNMPYAAQYLPGPDDLERDRGITLEVRQCGGCGLVQLANPPVHYFREVIRAAGFSPEMVAFRRDQFGAFIRGRGLEARKVLEVGCGRGDYLAILHECGVQAHGLEFAESAVEACRQRGLSASVGFIDSPEAQVDGAPYDGFILMNFLEHLPDPLGTLRGIAAQLAEGASGLVEVPNFDMMLEKNLFSEFVTDHLFYFTRATLTAALEQSGFQVLECREEWHRYILSAVVRKRGRLDLSGFQAHQDHLRTGILAFVNRFPEGRVAVWGAGHQALAMISLAELGRRIRYVIDSAPFKQGRFTPATHVPIVPPERLGTDPVDAVIVMAAGYSDEVARIIRRSYDPAIQVAILREAGLETA